MFTNPMTHARQLVVCGIAALVCGGCSLRQAGINRMASAVADSTVVYESDNDPEFVRLAAPSTLKTIEMLLSQNPKHPALLLTACSGFTEYSYAFLHVEAELQPSDSATQRDLRLRAQRMYDRARGYCERALDVRHTGMSSALRKDPVAALAGARKEDVPVLYWLGASSAAELALAPNQLMRVAELPRIRALLDRARALDEGWNRGAIYEALIALDGLPPLLGGSAAAARTDFDSAMRLSGGRSAFACVAYAATVTDRAEKEKLLRQALAIDANAVPERRLTNLVAQRYARALLNAAAPARPGGR